MKIAGYIIGIAGLCLLFWNAYAYLFNDQNKSIPGISGLFLCFIGAVLIKKSK